MRRALMSLAVPILLGCRSTEPVPLLDLSGSWAAQQVESSTTLSLVQLGDSVSGTGQYYRFINPPNGTIAVSGTYAHSLVTLTFVYSTGVTTHFVGTVPDRVDLVGVETYPGGTTDSLLFERR